MVARRTVLGLIGASAAAAGCVEQLFFHPDDRVYTRPAELGVDAQAMRFATEGGAMLSAWWLPARGVASGTGVPAHGNVAGIVNALPLVAWLPAAGLDVLTFDYRGFGRSEGRPTLDGVVADTRAAFAAARARSPRPLIGLGQSLGGATMLRAIAAEHAQGARDIRLAVIDAAFDSYRGIARHAAAWTPLALVAPLAATALPPTERDPIVAAASLGVPLLLLHGDADTVIPVEASERLHAAAAPPKVLLRIRGGGHLDALRRADVREHVRTAIDNALAA